MDNRDENVRIKRSPMPRQQRAKQFAPFQAVGGLDVALRQKEEEHFARLNQTVENESEASELYEAE